MSKIEKLIAKAQNSPQNLTFLEFTKILKYYGFKRRGVNGSHYAYKTKGPPSYTATIQSNKGKAVVYQVKQVLGFLDANGFLDKEDDNG